MPTKRAKASTRDRHQPCTTCGECWTAALRREGGLCLNCADTTHPHLRRCLVCLREDVPSEFHHVASKRHHATFGLKLCLNCHAILTHRQTTVWPATWQTESHPFRCLVQGMLDLVWLWWRRSHSAWALGQLAQLFVQAGWALFGTFGLVGWTDWQAA